MKTVALRAEELHSLVVDALTANGCDTRNADAVARNVTAAEQAGSTSHGLFRVPGHVRSLRSGKVNGAARPKIEQLTPAALLLDGDRGFAPLALEHGIPRLADAAAATGIAALAIRNSFHYAALWPEVEALAAAELVGLAFTAHTPMVAPFGASEPLFSTNPVAFAYPRPGADPYVFDMATSAMAKGDLSLAARRGEQVPPGTGVGPDGEPTTDARTIDDGGVLLPFGGYKGSAIATMVELLAAGVVGDNFSFEAAATDNGDGGPAIGGQLILALSPALLAGPEWAAHSESFLRRLEQIPGVRVPGQRRFAQRRRSGPIPVDADTVDSIRQLSD